MYLLISVFKFLMNVIYGLVKLLPCKRKICFFSRQSDMLPVDFKLLISEIKKTDGSISIITICNRFRNLHDGMFRFVICQLKSMYHLATSKVCIIDSYWPTVSMLNHKRSLTVIQIWHSIGKIKQSGYQTINKKGGRSSDIAKIMCMHKNYDYLIAGGKAWNKYYMEAFNIENEKILNYGLPRIDIMMKNKNKENLLLEKYPELQGKIIIFFAPTYRNYIINSHEDLGQCFNDDKYAYIYKLHPNQKIDKNVNMISKYDQEDTFSLLQLCDYFITDYSSLALEAALLDKKTLYYLPDYEKYSKENGLNIDLFKQMPSCTFTKAEDIVEIIEKNNYPYEELQKYKHKFLPEDLGVSTKKIANKVMECLG